MFRSTEAERAYKEYNLLNKTTGCPFCDLPKTQILKELKLFWVLKNRFPYTNWDTGEVEKHLMLVPKRHVSEISQFTEAEKIEYMSVLAQYESDGFDTYTRSGNNKGKSQPHFHTHLIKVTGRKFKFHIFNRKPYISFEIY
jgi:diadenosine tetraphosphate (Ap4A) HIT family hydrolase